MKHNVLIIILIIILFLAIIFVIFFSPKRSSQEEKVSLVNNKATTTTMILSSPAFSNNQYIPLQYTCDGEDINPPLKIDNVPENAKSLVLIVDDPDAPSKVWVHWVLWNIPPETKEIRSGEIPEEAVEGMTDFGKTGWQGPCPPSGAHRYFFKLYALDTTLDLPLSATKEDVEKAMQGHIIENTQLIGLYKRS